MWGDGGCSCPYTALGCLRGAFGGGVGCGGVEVLVVPGIAVANHLEIDVYLSKVDDAEDASVSVGRLVLDENFPAADQQLKMQCGFFAEWLI